MMKPGPDILLSPTVVPYLICYLLRAFRYNSVRDKITKRGRNEPRCFRLPAIPCRL